MWFHCNKEEGDDSFHHLLRWLYCNKKVAYAFFVVLLGKRWSNNVITFLYGGVVEKAMAKGNFFLFFFFFFLWCFRFSSLELTISNEMVVLFFCWRLEWLEEGDWGKVVVVNWKLKGKMLLH
jgi:hypothetical protein